MASIRSRKDNGKLFFDFRARGQRFREQTELDDTPANRKKMAAVASRLEYELQLGSLDYGRYFPNSPNRETYVALVTPSGSVPLGSNAGPSNVRGEATPAFNGFAETWFIENEVRWRRTTRVLIRMVVDKHLLPVFGSQPVASITRAEVLAFRAEFAKRPGKKKDAPISPKTVNDTMGVLKSILDEAAARFGFTSACQGLKRLKVPKTDVFPFTLEETRQLIATCRPDYRDYLTVRAFTGMRTGEVNGLKWTCVDFKRREILVRETFTHGQQDKTKTNSSVREIMMSPPVYDALKRLQDQAEDKDGYVFTNRNGQPFDNHNFTNRVWYPLLRYLNFRRRRPYQLRHTCATFWLTAGENPLWIARQLGHSSVEMLFRVYARWVNDVTRKDGSAFEKLLEKPNDLDTNEEECA
jgi:integrase